MADPPETVDAVAASPIVLDPFGYWPDLRSNVEGLGGTVDPPDRNYVFHSSYTSLGAGSHIAEIEFAGLEATSGNLEVNVFRLQPTANPPVTQVATTMALLPAISAAPRAVRVAFDADGDAQFAVVGYVHGDSEGRADALSMRLIPRHDPGSDPAGGRSLFGRWRARQTSRIASRDRPTLAYPVSQGFTREQAREVDRAPWSNRIDPTAPDEERWEAAYILRALETYGRLESGARGLGVSSNVDRLGEIASEQGCVVLEAVPGEGEALTAALDRSLLAAGAPALDFVWLRSDVMPTPDPRRFLETARMLIGLLRPGGLAVLLLEASFDAGSASGPDREAIKRIVLEIVSAGNFVAQLRHDADPPNARGSVSRGQSVRTSRPFGLIVRRSVEPIVS